MRNAVRYLDTYLLIHAGLLLLDLFLQFFQRSGVWGRAISFQYLDIPKES